MTPAASASADAAVPMSRRGRARLDRDQVLDVAFDLAGAEGLEAVTIRRLAQRLEVTPMALYWHFADKDGLFVGMGARLWADAVAELAAVDGADGAATDPLAGLRQVLRAVVAALARHPQVATLAFSAVGSSEPGLAVTERTLTLLEQLGYDAAGAAQVAHLMLQQAVGMVANQPGLDAADPAERDAIFRAKRAAMLALPPDRYPHVIAAADYLTSCVDVGAFFDRGVELFLGGIAHSAPTRRDDPPAA